MIFVSLDRFVTASPTYMPEQWLKQLAEFWPVRNVHEGISHHESRELSCHRYGYLPCFLAEAHDRVATSATPSGGVPTSQASGEKSSTVIGSSSSTAPKETGISGGSAGQSAPSNLPLPVILGIVFGVLVALGLFVGCWLFSVKRQRRNRSLQ